MRILITGGSGFVGGSLARSFLHESANTSVVLFDNLRRRGSEWNLAGLVEEGAQFVHGDVRIRSDFETLDGNFDVLIEASAEASVKAGIADSPRYVLDTNLVGAMNCLEFARERCGGVVFLSSSRVYSIESLAKVPLEENPTRLDFQDVNTDVDGLSTTGIAESFSCEGARSYYGASKLAAELLCQEYFTHAGLPVVINRCGVIAGPGQFGRTDQGVFSLWVARHCFIRPLKYTGYGGKGLQVRDLLHPEDLSDLVKLQLGAWEQIAGRTFNIGGGRRGAVSLKEFTNICQEITGHEVPIEEDATTSSVDVPWYITDHTRVTNLLDWMPTRSPRNIATDIACWIRKNEQFLSKVIV